MTMPKVLAFMLMTILLVGCAAQAPAPVTPAVEPVASALAIPGAPEGTGLTWQVAETTDMMIFHVLPLYDGEANRFQQVFEWVTGRMGRRLEDRLVIWLWPDSQAMYRWWKAPAGTNVTGVWDPKMKKMHMVRLNSSQNQAILLAHELTHAVMPGKAPHWWFYEGYAVLTQELYLRELGLPVDPAYGTGQSLQQLQLAAREGPITPHEATFERQYQTPWEIGLAVMLYVQHNHGEAGVKQLVAAGAEDPQRALEDLCGQSMADIWTDWNDFVKGPDLLKTWLTLQP